MSKKSYITMKSNKKSYKIYLTDIKRVHTAIKRPIPKAPAYN